MLWGPGKLVVFLVQSAYKLAFEEPNRTLERASRSAPDGHRSYWKVIWYCGVPPTLQNFACRVAIDSLPASVISIKEA